MKKNLILVFIVFLIVFCAAIAEASYPLKVQDDLGNVVTIPRKPMRIVSLAPSTTEIIFALGAGDRLVGRTDFCDYPAEAADVPSVGGYSDPSVESIMAVRPDLILASFGSPKDMLDHLKNLGIPVVGYDPQNIADIYRVVWEIGKVIGTEGSAAIQVKQMQDRFIAVEKLVANASRPKVFWEVWHDPIYTAGGDTYINDLIKTAGGINMAADTKGWPVYSLEMLLVKNPDIYIATQDQWAIPGNIPGRPGYNQMNAVKNGRVYILNANNVNRPSLRLVDGLDEVVRAIHPELFTDGK